MVLVAAIAAGVLINTAGLLQAQAQQTGAETTSQVSDRLEIGTMVGEAIDETNGSSANITSINATIKLSAGSDPINASQASYTIASSSNATIIDSTGIKNGSNSTAVEYFPKQGIKSNSTVIDDVTDLMVVKFNLSVIRGIQPLKKGSEFQIIIQAPAGGQSYTYGNAPKQIQAGESYIL
jgi:flagellin FlaB